MAFGDTHEFFSAPTTIPIGEERSLSIVPAIFALGLELPVVLSLVETDFGLVGDTLRNGDPIALEETVVDGDVLSVTVTNTTEVQIEAVAHFVLRESGGAAPPQ
jgi:hypothetical protein